MTNPANRAQAIDHRANAERALSTIDASDDPRNLPAGLDGIGSALLALHDLLDERLPKPAEPEQKDAPERTDSDISSRIYISDDLHAILTGTAKPAPHSTGESVDLEPAEVTEDQPVGTRIVDRWGDLHHRLDGGWGCLHGCCLVPFDRLPRPLRLATPADLARVGIEDEPAPADDLPGDRRVNVTITDVYAAPDEHGFLRINVGPEGATVDPDARNVTVTDVSDAPADDLPGEPVEPSDLRAGDKVAFTYDGERITCNLTTHPENDRILRSDVRDSEGYYPNVVDRGGKWGFGIFDVRLLEPAPREDEDRDEALAMDLLDEVDRLRSIEAGVEALADWHETKAEKAASHPGPGRDNRVAMSKAATVHRDATRRLRDLLDPTEGENR